MLPRLIGLFSSPSYRSFLSLFFQIGSQFLTLSFLWWHPHDANVAFLEVVPDVPYTILIFLDSFFFFFLTLSLFLGVPFSFSFYLKVLFIFREGKGGRKRGRETSMCGCLLRAPHCLQPRHVP